MPKTLGEYQLDADMSANRDASIDCCNVVYCTTFVIKSFADKKTKEIFAGRPVKNIHSDLQTKTLRRLPYINAAESLDDLRVPPCNKLEKKAGDLQDFYAIWVNSQFRILFRWQDGGAYEVQMVDYH